MTKLIAHRIKELRRSLGVSQNKFAELLNAGVASVRRWESGRTEPLPIYQDKINQLENLDAVRILKDRKKNL